MKSIDVVLYTNEMDELLDGETKELIETHRPDFDVETQQIQVISVKNMSNGLKVTYDLYLDGKYRGMYKQSLVLH
jgi:hypothetical protein